MNNKGFAISTVIYGLSILGMMLIILLMSIMSTSRSNNTNLSKTIEDDLNRFSRTETSFSTQVSGSTPTAQEYTVPEGETGWYKIELWGSKGSSSSGGRGAYTSGVIELKEGDTLYFYVGRDGKETDVRVINGAYSNADSVKSRIMVAGGGGTASGSHGGTLVGYQTSLTATDGGVDITGTNKDYSLTSNTLVGYPTNYPTSITLHTTPTSSPVGSSGGGDGYVASTSNTIGGTSYISGYAKCSTYNYFGKEYNEEDDAWVNNESTSRLYYFVDGMMFAGVNEGPGKAKIERLVEKKSDSATISRKNTKLNDVSSVRDCITGTNNADIVVMAGGKNIVSSITSSGNCRVATLSVRGAIDEIATFHTPGTDYKNHTIEVSATGSTWSTVKGSGSGTELSETETPVGNRISAYQPDYTQQIPSKGNYYLLPVLSENKVITAKKNAEDNSNPINIKYIQGLEEQKWSVELLTEEKVSPTSKRPEYKLVELSQNKAMSIYQDENIIRNQISANSTFNTYARNEPQIWKITPVGNGTYKITTVVDVFDTGSPSGNILPQTNDSKRTLIIGKNNNTTERFRFISIDYSSS